MCGRRAVALEYFGYLLRFHALQNVFKNAVEACAEAKGAEGTEAVVEVSARLEEHDALVVLSVADRGRGISKKARERLFSPLESLKAGGSGIGLRVVRRAIEVAHHGRLEVVDRDGGGTVVEMRLPQRQS